MGDRSPAAGGDGKGRRKQPFLYSCGSNLLPRVGRRFGKIFKAILLPGSGQSLRGPYRLALGSTTCFQEEPHGSKPKSCQVTEPGGNQEFFINSANW